MLKMFVAVIFLSACGVPEPTPIEQMGGTWDAEVTVQALTFDPSQPAPRPFTYTARLSASHSEATLTVTGLCPDAGGAVVMGGSSERPFWRGAISGCASFPTLDCMPSVYTLSSLDLSLTGPDQMVGEGGGEVRICGSTFPALLKIVGARASAQSRSTQAVADDIKREVR